VTALRKSAAGRRLPLVDGVDKVTGRAQYTADLEARGALVGRIFRSRWPHAKILRLDVEAARKLPGVRAVVTGDDATIPYGVLPISQNETPMARGKIRYRGEPIAAVAAIDEATADRALALIKIEVEELPAYFEASESRKAGAVAIHDDKPDNLLRAVHHDFGDVPAGFAAAELVKEKSFRCAEVAHGQIEPHAAVAHWDEESQRLDLKSVTQVPYYVHMALARVLNIEAAQIRIVKPFVGGGFGARVEVLNFEIILGLLARAAKGTVRFNLSREETFLTHRGRPLSELKLKIGMTKDGRITAVQSEVVQRGGAYASYGVVTILYAGSLLHGLYDIPAIKYDGYRVYTNTPPCGAMRGHGGVNARHAFECLMDEMASDLGLDPFAVRRRNLLKTPMQTMNGVIVNSYGLPECLDKVEAASGWKGRKGKLPPGKGLGMSCSHYVSGAAKPIHWTGEPHAALAIRVDFDGGLTVLTGAADIGQGSSTILAQLVAETLDVPMARIRVIANDSALTPKDNGSYSSRVTFMVGNAAIDAARSLRKEFVAAAAKRLDARPEMIEINAGTFNVVGGQGPGLTFPEVVQAALADRGPITVTGTFTVPVEYQGGKHRGGAVGSTMGFSYAAQVVEVDVDPDTGIIRVPKVWVAHDCGFAINPLSVEGQVQGAVWMGLGQALYEETRFDEGLPAHGSFLEYRIATSLDSPDIDVQLVESNDPSGPLGAKEASEGALLGVPPAVANAVYDALGIRVVDTPITPEKIIDAMTKLRREKRLAAAKGGR